MPETSEDLMRWLIDLVKSGKLEENNCAPVVVGAGLIDQFCAKKTDPMQQLSEWLTAAEGRHCEINAAGSNSGLNLSRTCDVWLLDEVAEVATQRFGTDPKTLSDVVAEALADVQKR